MDTFSAPLWNRLIGQADRTSFHMPGHRQGRVWDAVTLRRLASLDTTELPGTGDLASPDAHVRDACERAADCFGAGETFFITSGTTASIMIMMASVLREGDALILPRAVHMAAVHAAALLGLVPVFAGSPDGRPFADGQPDGASIAASIKKHPEARACFVTCPDYYGRTIDLESAARTAHEAGIPLLVDEAHGTHFSFLPGGMPAPALSRGADMVCQSAHKTLPALTPASFLHLSAPAIAAGRIDRGRVGQMVHVFQTSSPSFLIAATMDWARAYMASRGTAQLERVIALNASLAGHLPDGFERLFPEGSDPVRLVIDFSKSGLTRRMLEDHLVQCGIDVEMIDLCRMVLLPSVDQPEEDYKRLSGALQSAAEWGNGRRPAGTPERQLRALETERDALLSAPSAFRILPREALFGRSVSGRGDLPDGYGSTRPTDRKDAFPSSGVIGDSGIREVIGNSGSLGRIADAVIAPYPPGLSVVWPGEPVLERHRVFLRKLLDAGIAVRGL